MSGANGADDGNQTPPHNFRGHPQPPVDERLQNAKNFLADEDPERCLDFATKISEIEEYLDVITNEGLGHDPTLFKDVDIMVAVHRDWRKRIEEGPRYAPLGTEPLIQPYSTRLVSSETGKRLEAERAAFGCTNYTREDHSPFTVDRQNDQTAFLRAFHADAAKPPAAIDKKTNLLWVDSQAFSWAMRNPSLIPSWMHPTKGIPRKGLKATDEIPWYRAPDPPSEAVRNRPARGWMPSYLLDLEDEINTLVKQRTHTIEEWERLEEMLRLLEPEILQHLHIIVDDLVKAERGGYLGNRQAQLDHAISEFQVAQLDWVQSFQQDGVFFILRRPGDDEELEVDQPGVFYINHGFSTQLHQDNVTRINGIFKRYSLSTQSALTKEEQVLLKNLFRIVCPDNIHDLREQRTAILVAAGANRFEDLSGAAETSSNNLLAQITTAQLAWETIIIDNQAQFIYLRLGERLPQRNNSLLYLPWRLTELPIGEAPLRRCLTLPPEIMQMQLDVRHNLSINHNRDIQALMDNSALINSAYPELRALLIPWVILNEKRTNNLAFELYETNIWQILDPMVQQYASNWLRGFDHQRLLFKIPLPEQNRDSPGNLYWHGSDQQLNQQLAALDLNLVDLPNTVQDLMDRISVGGPNQAANERSLKEILREFQYPAMERVYQNLQNARTNENLAQAGTFQAIWDGMYNRWLASKQGFRLNFSGYNGNLDRDDDPSVVYYRGPLPKVGDLALTVPEGAKDYLVAFLNRDGALDEIPSDIRQDFPPEVENAFQTYERWPNPVGFEPILRWYFQILIINGAPESAFPNPNIQISLPATPDASLPANGTPHLTPPFSYDSLDPNCFFRNSFLTLNILASTQGVPAPGNLPTPPNSTGNSPNTAGRIPSDVNPDLNVDLGLAITHLTSLEQEINRSLGHLNDNADWTGFDFQRLWSLLEQFYPDDVRRAQLEVKDCIDRRTILADASSLSPGRSEDQYHQLYELFRKRQVHWLRKTLLASFPWRIRIADETKLDGLLSFNPSVTDKGASCVIKAPNDGTVDASPIRDIHPGQLPQAAPTLNINPRLEELLNDISSGINPLLRKWRANTINFEQSDILLDKLSVVMPSALFRQESELRTIDTAARARQLTADENIQFWSLWDTWGENYEAWLRSLDQDGVQIATNPAQLTSVDNTRILRFQRDHYFTRASTPPARSREMPYPVRDAIARLGILLNSARELTNDDEIIGLDLILRNVWRQTGQHLRGRLHDRFVTDYGLEGPANLDEDHLIIVETLLAEAYSLFKVSAKRSPSAQVDIEEPVPGRYEFYYTSDSIARGQWLDEWLDDAIDSLFPGVGIVDDVRRDFYNLARRLRGGATPSESEIATLADFFQPLSNNHLLKLYDAVSNLATSYRQGNASRDNISSLRRTEKALLWYRWAFSNTSTDMKVLETISWIKSQRQGFHYGDPRLIAVQTGLTHVLVDEIVLMLALAGTTPRGPNPRPSAPPNLHQIRETEIEVNNLLARERTGIITGIELTELNYLLRGVMDIKLKNLHDEMARLDVIFVQQPGLAPRQTLSMASATKAFDIQFQRFKAGLPPFGIALDHWWYTDEEIAEICFRARMWREATSHAPATTFPTFPTRGDTIESPQLEEWHRVYARLAKFMDDGCPNNPVIGENLLLQSLATNRLGPLLDQIRREIVNIRNLEQQNDFAGCIQESIHTRLRRMQEDFVHFFMEWYTHPTTDLKKLKQEASVAYVAPIDFTTKAERRGIQRAAIEIALNTMATNQEQHRPHDRFRVVSLPPPYRPAPAEVSSALPLEPSKRPLEQDPFDYTKKLLAYRQWKDYDYAVARGMTQEDYTEVRKVPLNFQGPFILSRLDDLKVAKREMLGRLTGISRNLKSAYDNAPRPLLQNMIDRIDAGIIEHRTAIPQLTPLTKEDIDLLRSLAEPSWDEEQQPYDKNIPSITNVNGELAKFKEFEKEIKDEIENRRIPLWIPFIPQLRYNSRLASVPHIKLAELVHSLNDIRMDITGPQQAGLASWTIADAYRYLMIMFNARRIHLDPSEGNVQQEAGISRIPLSGHPENKFVTSTENIYNFAGVRPDVTGQPEVRYNKLGKFGPPILQPNRDGHLETISYSLGRYMMKLLVELAAESNGAISDDDLLSLNQKVDEVIGNMDRVQHQDAPDANAITLHRLALDLLRVAPDLVDDAGFDFQGDPETNMDVTQAATLLQMQLVEESNNNWEFRFPEEEHVWDFATPRITPTERMATKRNTRAWAYHRLTQYFSMRRHPPENQCATTQEHIKNSGPAVPEKPQTQTPAQLLAQNAADRRLFYQARVAANMAGLPLKVDRHISGQRPNFPFGETPYQAAYQSFRMENELKDVPEFQPRPEPRRRFFSLKRKREQRSLSPGNRYALPDLPANWQPTNISLAEARINLIQAAQEAPGFPDSDDMDYYWTQDEIRDIKYREEWVRGQDELLRGIALVERDTGKKWSSLTPQEIHAAHTRLGIDNFTGRLITPTASTTVAAAARPLLGGAGAAQFVIPAGEGFTSRRARRNAQNAQRPRP